MRKLLTISCLLISTSMSAYAADEQSACKRYIDATSKRVDTIFHDSQMSFLQKRASLSKLFDEGVDIAWLTQYTAGTYWNSSSEQERKEYAKAYRAYLSDKYIGALTEEDINSMGSFKLVDFTTLPSNEYQARIDITQTNDDPISVDLRLQEKPAGVCHVHDFTVEGVSLVQNQYDQIQSLAAQGGLAPVIQKLKSLVGNAQEASQ